MTNEITIGTTTYTVEQGSCPVGQVCDKHDNSGSHFRYLLTGPRGAQYGLVSYMQQPHEGVEILFAWNAKRLASNGPAWERSMFAVVEDDTLKVKSRSTGEVVASL